jgi:lipopolysaccharide/colanic/teichoic acid biosynthesis glycosyltransferase
MLQATVKPAGDGFETTLEAYWRAALARSIQRRLTYAAKRLMDLLLASVLVILLIPGWLLAALAIKLSSDGPVLFRQRRVGKDWQEFSLLKFRTMVDGADRQRSLLTSLNEADGPLFKAREDPRVTRVGRFLRKTFLDETPQLINVLRGEMSLVGPRPCLPDEIAQIEEAMYFRFAVPQGITGPWQTNGYHKLSFRDQLGVELDYVRNWSLGRDVSILLRTVPMVLERRGV